GRHSSAAPVSAGTGTRHPAVLPLVRISGLLVRHVQQRRPHLSSLADRRRRDRGSHSEAAGHVSRDYADLFAAVYAPMHARTIQFPAGCSYGSREIALTAL